MKLVGHKNFKRVNPLSDRFHVHRFHHLEYWCVSAPARTRLLPSNAQDRLLPSNAHALAGDTIARSSTSATNAVARPAAAMNGGARDVSAADPCYHQHWRERG
jgi:hypothetical protein